MHVVFNAGDLKTDVDLENARPHNLKTALFELYLKTPSAEYVAPSGKYEVWKQGTWYRSERSRILEMKDVISKRLTECFRTEISLGEVRRILLEISEVVDRF